jgi:hypothetical protein
MNYVRPEIQIEHLEKRIQDGETYLRVRAIPKESRTDSDQRALLRFQIARRMYDLNLDKKPSAEEFLQILRDNLETEQHILADKLTAQMNATEYGVVGPPNTDGNDNE